jgi:5-methylcytosine-specific restriction endonuclease McrA
MNSPIFWIIALVAVILTAVFFIRRRLPPIDRNVVIDETREAAREALQKVAPEVIQEASNTALKAYQLQQETLREEQALRRKATAVRARETRERKIAELQTWRPTFVQFVRKLAEPYFLEWGIDSLRLDAWSEERAAHYIQRKPYVLEIIRSVHADAQRAAEVYANPAEKSPREIARARAKGTASTLERNGNCPYCGVQLDERSHLDHIIPVQRGGPSEPWNMVFVCIPCNRAKRDHSLWEFLDTDYARQKSLRTAEIMRRLKELGKYVEVLQ